MNKIKRANQEVTDNYQFFKTQLVSLMKNHAGKYALLHKQKIIEFFDSENDAIKVGIKDYSEGCFSVQQVDNKMIDLGYQSNVLV